MINRLALLAGLLTFVSTVPVDDQATVVSSILSDQSSATELDVDEEWCSWCGKHGKRKWGWLSGDCRCKAGWKGACCKQPNTCPPNDGSMCPFKMMKPKMAKCTTQGKDGPITVGTAAMGLPKQMQGVFWLTKQGDSSSLMSFATSNDGGDLSKLDMSAKYAMKIRVAGDRVWSFSHKSKSWLLVWLTDLVYQFQMEKADGSPARSPDEIAAAQIIPHANSIGISLNAPIFLSFRMTLSPAGTHAKYPNSVVWGRPSKLLGISGAYYELTQVIDGEGNKLEPAYSDWLKFCASSESGNSEGYMHYRVAK